MTTKEEKELLIKDLCSRLPYSLKVRRPDDSSFDYVSAIDIGASTLTCLYNGYTDDIEKFVPYLRSLSSMTEEDKKELGEITCNYDSLHKWAVFYKSQDWLNAHHFDYRGLIEKGLALEAPDGMYKLKEK